MVSALRGHAPLLLHGDPDGLGLLCEHLFALSAAFPPGRLATATCKAPFQERREHMPTAPHAAITSPHPPALSHHSQLHLKKQDTVTCNFQPGETGKVSGT